MDANDKAVSNNNSAMNNSPTNSHSKPNGRDLSNSRFWISQACVIIATIVGVFLAAQQGLSQALLFDTLNSKESNFYLRYSLDNEISSNIVTLKEYANLLKQNKIRDLKSNRPALQRFVWETMKYSPATLETPSHILAAANQFYLQTNILLNQIENRKFGAQFAAKKMIDLLTTMEESGLKSLRSSHQKLKAELADADITVATN